MGTPKLDNAVRRVQIVRAAIDIMARHGLRELGVGAIARRIGLVPSAIYRHFRGKEEILDAVVGLVEDQLRSNVVEARKISDDAIARIEGLLDRHSRLIRENRGLARLVFSGELFSGRPARRQRLRGVVDDYRGSLAAIVREGQAAGRIRADVDPDTVFLLYLGLIQPGAFLWHLSDGDHDVTREARKAWAVLKEALEPRAGAPISQ